MPLQQALGNVLISWLPSSLKLLHWAGRGSQAWLHSKLTCGTLKKKTQTIGLTLEFLNQDAWGWGQDKSVCFLNSTPNSNVLPHLRTELRQVEHRLLLLATWESSVLPEQTVNLSDLKSCSFFFSYSYTHKIIFTWKEQISHPSSNPDSFK